MPKRIFLVHPTPLALPPVDEAFKKLWPQAQVLNLLDESLYADVGANGEASFVVSRPASTQITVTARDRSGERTARRVVTLRAGATEVVTLTT